MADETVPSVGYDQDGNAQTFMLKRGEMLPDGFTSDCPPWAHPNTKHLHKRPNKSAAKEPEPESKTPWAPEFEPEIEVAAVKPPPARRGGRKPPQETA